MRGWGRAALGLVAGLMAGPAAAYDSTPLHAAGVWAVEHGYDPARDRSFCAAETVNRAGQVFGMTAEAHGAATVFVADPGWSLAVRPVRFSIHIDDKRWAVEGDAAEDAVSVALEGNAGAGWFLAELAGGHAVVVLSEAEVEVAAFSLEGFAEALTPFVTCWQRILEPDPFTRAADPF